MGFSNEWDKIYTNNQQLVSWPWSDLISYVKRYIPVQEKFNILELGCGAGANIPFFDSLNVNYYGIEGSENIVGKLKDKFPKYSENIIASDFTKNLISDLKFDLIFDRASVTHNTTDSIKNCLKLVDESLISGGYYIGIDWFSKSHSDFNLGESVDEYTKTNIENGQFNNVGNVHFSDQKHIEDLFKGFEFIKLEEKVITDYTTLNDNHVFASWNFIVKKI